MKQLLLLLLFWYKHRERTLLFPNDLGLRTPITGLYKFLVKFPGELLPACTLCTKGHRSRDFVFVLPRRAGFFENRQGQIKDDEIMVRGKIAEYPVVHSVVIK